MASGWLRYGKTDQALPPILMADGILPPLTKDALTPLDHYRATMSDYLPIFYRIVAEYGYFSAALGNQLFTLYLALQSLADGYLPTREDQERRLGSARFLDRKLAAQKDAALYASVLRRREMIVRAALHDLELLLSHHEVETPYGRDEFYEAIAALRGASEQIDFMLKATE